MFQRLLICTDLQDGMQRLLEHVPSLAQAGVQKLVFLHCVPIWQEGEIPREDTAAIANAQAKLNAAKCKATGDIEVITEVKSGPVVDNIVQVKETHAIEAIVLGAHTRSLLTEKLFGSTTATISQQANIPLIVLRPELISTYTEAELALRCQNLFRYLLIPIHGTDTSNQLLQQVRQTLEQNPQHTVRETLLLSICEDYGQSRRIPVEYDQDVAQEALVAAQTQMERVGLKITTEFRKGERLAQLFDVAMVYDITAIAITSRKTNALLDWSIPSFGNELLRRSWHPVIFFPINR
ncbi:MAG: universal stress protein [Cyanobacteria bacterium P01_H01_bin.121]